MDKITKKSILFYVIAIAIAIGVLVRALYFMDSVHQLEMQALLNKNYIEAMYYAAQKGTLIESFMLIGISLMLLRLILRR